MESKIRIMNDLLKIQGQEGNYNYDSYMLGMYNGMELMLSIAEGREPKFKLRPKGEKLDENGRA